MGKYFGTDGFRGKAGQDLTALHAFKIGRYLGWYYKTRHNNEHAKIVIGKDTRRSSYMLESAIASGIAASGADGYLLHVTTTPCVSYITRNEKFDCGVMISASHNPYFDNGIKLVNEEGEKMPNDVLDEIEKYIDGEIPEIPFATDDNVGKVIDYYFGRNRYVGYVTSIATQSFENYKVALDCANGSTWELGKSVFNALGAKTSVIANEPDGTNINSACGSTHIENLQKYVRENGMNVGFAFDGDADRCLAVDELGNVVNGDEIMYVCAKYLKEQDMLPTNTVVTTVMSNFGLYKALDNLGIKYEKTLVGDKYVYECMKKNGHHLGGEQSGHIIFRKYAHTGDGLVTSVMLMQVLIATKLPLSVLTKEITMYPQVLTNVEVDSKKATMEDPIVIKAEKDASAKLGTTGRTLLRESGTEPVIRVMAEAETMEAAQAAVEEMIAGIRVSGHLLKVR